jgi:hypothetical protein
MKFPMFRGTSETFKTVTVQRRANDDCRRRYPGARSAKSDYIGSLEGLPMLVRQCYRRRSDSHKFFAVFSVKCHIRPAVVIDITSGNPVLDTIRLRIERR